MHVGPRLRAKPLGATEVCRVMHARKPFTQTGNADFFILLSGGAGAQSKVDAVKFISGSEKLKSFTEALRTADYHLTFPDDTPVKVLRRGTLSCSLTTGRCEFSLMLPDDVRTVD